jgi:hypothetical protein
MPESIVIDLDEPLTVADLLDVAGGPNDVSMTELTIVYGGCGSHGVMLSWPVGAERAPVGDEVSLRAEIATLRSLLDALLADQGCDEDGSYIHESARRAEAYLNPPDEGADLDAATGTYAP